MATRDDVYKKFGFTAEAAQLFETELGTLLLGVQGLKKGWKGQPDPEAASHYLDHINEQTLGRLLRQLKESVGYDAQISALFDNALRARNQLFHGFYLKHNVKIQTDDGRDAMIADLEALHGVLFNAWQIANKMTGLAMRHLSK